MNDVVVGLLRDIYVMRRQVHVTRLEFSKPVEQERRFRYGIVLKDTRRWHQELFFGDDGSVSMTFSVADRWELGEFALQRPIRDGLVRAVKDFDVTSVVATFVDTPS